MIRQGGGSVRFGARAASSSCAVRLLRTAFCNTCGTRTRTSSSHCGLATSLRTAIRWARPNAGRNVDGAPASRRSASRAVSWRPKPAGSAAVGATAMVVVGAVVAAVVGAVVGEPRRTAFWLLPLHATSPRSARTSSQRRTAGSVGPRNAYYGPALGTRCSEDGGRTMAMPSLELEVGKQAGWQVLRVKGEVDISTAPR